MVHALRVRVPSSTFFLFDAIKSWNSHISFACRANIGFQDSCDGNFIVDLPNFRAIEASL